MIFSARMMLERLEEPEAAAPVEEAVIKMLRDGDTMTPDLDGMASTEEVAAAIARKLAEKRF